MAKTLLVIGAVWPEPTSSAAGWRMLEIIRFFQSEDYQVTFASAAQKTAFSVDFSALDVREKSIELNSESFDVFVTELSPRIVLFDRFMVEEQFGWRVAEFAPNALRILDTEDLHCLRLARQLAVKENRLFSEDDLFSDEAKREIASIYRCDLTLMISSVEMDILQRVLNVPKALLHYLPFTVKWEDVEHLSFDERQHFVTIGNFIHPPNWDAVMYLKKEIWPLIRKQLPKVEMHVYGAYDSQKVHQLHQPKEGFLIKGRAKDAQEVIGKARVLLAPLRFGAGLKGKLLDAMLAKTPSITSPVGAEGMTLQNEWPGAIASDPQYFAAKAVHYYSDSQAWKNASESCKAHVTQLFNREEHFDDFKKNLHSLINRLKEHRKSNFIGAMLQHHTLRSTKYFAKWIEAKNQS